MHRMLIWTGFADFEMEYQTYYGELLIGGGIFYVEGLRAIRHVECGEVLLAVI